MAPVQKKLLSAAALVLVWCMVWEIAFLLSGKEAWEFTPPDRVFTALWNGLLDLTIVRGLAVSLARVGYGFAMSLFLGVGIGLLLVASKWFNWLCGPLVLGVQSLPSICWLPVAILRFGIGETAILFVVIMGSVGSIAMATRDGLRQVPASYQRVASTFGTNMSQRLMWVSIPAALPTFVSGLKQGWSFAWRSLLAGELLYKMAGRYSMGSLLSEARENTDYPSMFAVMILLVCVSVLVDKVFFSRLEERVRARWGLAAR
ncbi:MAG TPA: ABC transporter permease [Planctomycetota bacterium]